MTAAGAAWRFDSATFTQGITKGEDMGWWYLAASWLLLSLLLLAFFHAMITVRNMEEIDFGGEDDLYE